MNSLLITLIAGLFFLVGSLIALFIKNNKALINFSIGMSFIVLILLVLIDILPECFELFTKYKVINIGAGIIVGFGLLMLLEKFVPHHDHYENTKHHEHHLTHIGVMTALALIIHNLVEGAGIYGVATTSLKAGMIYAIGVGLHNIPFGINITAMLNEQNNKKKMWIYIVLLTLSTFIGGFIIHLYNNLLSDFLLGTMLSITVGMIIYLVIWELLIELKESFNKYSFFGILIGILLMFIGVVI